MENYSVLFRFTKQQALDLAEALIELAAEDQSSHLCVGLPDESLLVFAGKPGGGNQALFQNPQSANDETTLQELLSIL
jgi:hypothetical protein